MNFQLSIMSMKLNPKKNNVMKESEQLPTQLKKKNLSKSKKIKSPTKKMLKVATYKKDTGEDKNILQPKNPGMIQIKST